MLEVKVGLILYVPEQERHYTTRKQSFGAMDHRI